MKPTNPPNFIVVLATMVCICLSISGLSQTTTIDSLHYYSKVVNQPQNAEQLVKAYKFFEQHQQSAQLRNDFETVAHDVFQLARIHYKGGFYNESEMLCIEVLHLLDQLPQDSYSLDFKKSVNNHLGMLYREQKHKPKALELYGKALLLSPNASDSAVVYNNMSNVHKDFKAYQTAKSELLKAYHLLPSITDTLTQALILDNMGYLNFKLKDTSALTLFHKALELRLQVGDTAKAFSSYHNLSAYYQDQDTAKAMVYALKAYTISKTLNNPHYQEEALGLLANLKAAHYFAPYITLRDSLEDAKQLVQNRFATLKYDVSKSEVQAEREKTKRLQYQTIFFIILGIGTFIIFLIRANAKKQRLLDVYTTETRISKKVHDEIANDVYQMMTNLQLTKEPNEALLDDLERIYIKTRDISKENTPIDMNQNFDEVLQDLLLAYKSPNTNITTLNSEKVNWQKLSPTKKHSIYRVIQELMTNMKKHSMATHVVISFSQKRSKIQMVYKDNGVGCKLQKHTGLQNAENRIHAIKGSITFESEPQKGFQATLLI